MKRMLFSHKPPPLWLFVAALMLWWLGCSKEQMKKYEEERRQKAEAERQVVKEVSLQLATVRGDFPDLKALQEGPCPDSEIKEFTAGVAAKEIEAPGYFTYTDYDLLETYTNPNLKSDDQKLKGWDFMESPEIRELRTSKKADASSESDFDREEAAKKAQIIKVHRYVVVFRSATKNLPQVREDGPYSMGTYDGWAALFDLQQPTKPLCAGKIAFTSSEKVRYYKEGGIVRKNLAQAVDSDFQDRFKEAAKQTVSKLSPALRANNF